MGKNLTLTGNFSTFNRKRNLRFKEWRRAEGERVPKAQDRPDPLAGTVYRSINPPKVKEELMGMRRWLEGKRSVAGTKGSMVTQTPTGVRQRGTANALQRA